MNECDIGLSCYNFYNKNEYFISEWIEHGKYTEDQPICQIEWNE